jgi:hypothetical protein
VSKWQVRNGGRTASQSRRVIVGEQIGIHSNKAVTLYLKDGKMERWKDGRKEGKKEGRKEGR